MNFSLIYRFALLVRGKLKVFSFPAPVTLCEGEMGESHVTAQGEQKDVVVKIMIIVFKHE